MVVPSNVAELLIIRHGETTWNALGRLQSQTSMMSASNKRMQLSYRKAFENCFAEVAEKLASLGLQFAAIYSSDLQRAVDTAQVIAEKCQCPKIILQKNLRERCLGDLEGLTRSEARVTAPAAYKAFMASDDNTPLPGGGESLEQLHVRAQDAIEQIVSENLGHRVVIVTHGGLLRALHTIAKGLPCSGKVVNASINIFRISDDSDWTLCSWNATSHLQGIGFLSSGFGGDKLSG